MSQNLPTYVTISGDASFDLSQLIYELKPDKIAVLVDKNTRSLCLPKFNNSFDRIIEIAPGEIYKTLSTCEYIWKELTDARFTRKSLLVNLGGGVIGDMGGFAAATFKRGIRFINIPTTLLSQVDASIGGKLSVDFGVLKNHIGLFRAPDAVIVDTHFLSTLPERELRSGYAEIIKHCLIHDASQWEFLKQENFKELNWEQIVPRSIAIKQEIVSYDPLETGLRKILNFGHTLGHAIESHLLKSATPLLHGEAVAAGMILEGHLSLQRGAIKQREFEEIQNLILSCFYLPDELPVYDELENYLFQDKKNEGKNVSFSLINGIGSCEYDVSVSKEMIQKSLDAFNQMKRSS